MIHSILGKSLSRKLIKEKISSEHVILYRHILLDYKPNAQNALYENKCLIIAVKLGR
jgi:hypothetical protein